ncbi:MAG TPA: glycosyltransferase family 4 protein [Marmoricola sp.]|nr:glycosyltransferase family 4 protein [Marmoricola sp.]
MTERMRFYLAWQYITGYSTSGMQALHAAGHDVRLMYQQTKSNFWGAFDDEELTAGLHATGWDGEPDVEVLLAELEEFQPDVLVVNSWHIPAYMKAAKQWRGKALRIVVMDHQWHATPKQRLASLTRDLYIQRYFESAFMPGDEQAEFARRLGFKQHEIITGLYTCETSFFTGPQATPQDAFLFVGRLVATKGLDVLAAAYQQYRAESDNPWPLTVAGLGTMEEELKAIPGVELLGFVGPRDLPGVMARSGCLILPSRFEPWGVVIQEAAASGQGVICTSACGAASRLVNDGYNGRVVAPDQVGELVEAMHWMANADPAKRLEISQRSVELAKQYTPERWVEQLVNKSVQLLPEARGAR